MPSGQRILLSPSPPALNLSYTQGLFFSSKSALCIKWPKYWSFSFSISPSRIFGVDFLSDWLVWSPSSPRDSWESLLQHHSLKALIHQHSAFCVVQLSHPYVTTGKTIIFDYTDFSWQSDVSAFLIPVFATYSCHCSWVCLSWVYRLASMLTVLASGIVGFPTAATFIAPLHFSYCWEN